MRRLNAALAAAEEAKETGGAEHAPPELVAHAQDPVLHGAVRVVLLLIGEIIFLMVLKPGVAGIAVSLVVLAAVAAAAD